MKITNRLKLPQPLVDAVSSDYQPTPYRYSATTLLKGDKEIILSRRHGDEITQDVSEMIWLIFGKSVHKICEEAEGTEDQIKENRIEWQVGNGATVSGIFDLYDRKLAMVVDYKTASVNKVIFNDWSDYIAQLEIYAVLLRENGYECNSGEIIAFLKDWTKQKARADHNYPQLPVYIKHVNMTEEDIERRKKWLIARTDNLLVSEKMQDDEIEPCQAHERWARPTTWAVMRDGRKTALRVFEDQNDAYDYLLDHNVGKDRDKLYVQERKGEDSKCVNYCQCSAFCNYFKNRYGKGK